MIPFNVWLGPTVNERQVLHRLRGLSLYKSLRLLIRFYGASYKKVADVLVPFKRN